jgi:hypothetical protein
MDESQTLCPVHAAKVSDWSVSTLPLRSSGVSVLAPTGATIRTLPDPTLGAGSARRLSELSMARHPSNVPKCSFQDLLRQMLA